MPLYKCYVKGWPEENQTVFAATPSKARYSFWLDLDSYDFDYTEIRCQRVKDYSDRDKKRFQDLKEYRGIPFAYLGMLVEFNGRKGEIVGVTDSACVNVYFYDEKRTGGCHPHSKMKYFDKDGKCIWDSENII